MDSWRGAHRRAKLPRPRLNRLLQPEVLMPVRPWCLAELVWPAIRDSRFEVAVLPWGATEAHNRHLPYATDTIQVEAVAALAAERAWELGAQVLVLPAVPFGVQTGQRDIPFCLNLNPSTQAAILRDLIRSIAPHGVRKLVILNGHGGNDFRQIIRELEPESAMVLCQVNWYQAERRALHFSASGDHADELETSVMLHLAPDLVRPLGEAGRGQTLPSRLRAVREGWAWIPRPWSRVTEDTGSGDPALASQPKGAGFVDVATRRLGDFLAELAQADPADLWGD